MYPALAEHIPYLPLAVLPTPIREYAGIAQQHQMKSLHIKCDNESGVLYGGNKTRKLGFLLGAARARRAKSVITFGAAGSNHALATALYARECGMKAILILGPQHNSHHVRENLQAMYQADAILRPCSWKDTIATTAAAFHEAWQRDGTAPYIIPPGGSSPLGALGFVNAACELHQQIESGILPEPDVIYAASGTMGTCIGLALGCCALGMKTKVMAVRVTTEPYTGMERAERLFRGANRMLRQADPQFPVCGLAADRFEIRDEFFGEDYALHTPEGIAAVKFAQQAFGVHLEGAYTGKALSGLLADASSGRLENKRALFWNTYHGGMPQLPETDFSYERLPIMLQYYFESEPQVLDAE